MPGSHTNLCCEPILSKRPCFPKNVLPSLKRRKGGLIFSIAGRMGIVWSAFTRSWTCPGSSRGFAPGLAQGLAGTPLHAPPRSHVSPPPADSVPPPWPASPHPWAPLMLWRCWTGVPPELGPQNPCSPKQVSPPSSVILIRFPLIQRGLSPNFFISVLDLIFLLPSQNDFGLGKHLHPLKGLPIGPRPNS